MATLRFISDSAHGWLEVPTVDVAAAGVTPSRYSYIDATNGMTYLEEDCDIAGFLSALGVALADVPDVVQHIATYRYSMGNCWIRELPHCSGQGFVSPFAR